MTGHYMDGLVSALGSCEQTVEQAEAAGQLLSTASALRSAGFDRHHLCVDGENAYDLARAAVAQLDFDLTRVGCIVYATCIPGNANVGDPAAWRSSRDVKHLMDFPASRLQAEFGMTRAYVIGLNQQACTGMLGAVRLARNLLVAEPETGPVLCVTADRFPPNALYEQSYNLISDGAAACVIDTWPSGFRFIAGHHETNGALTTASDDETVGSYFTNVHRVVMQTLALADKRIDEVRWVVPQNTNRKAWRVLAGVLGVSEEQAWFPSIGEAAHVISADNVINLAALQASRKVDRGDLVLTFMAGYGANWQCLLLEVA